MIKSRFTAVVIIVVLALAIGPFTALAQDLSQSYTSTDGTFSFQYPGDWTASEYYGTILAANSEEAAASFFEDTTLAAGQAVIAILPPTAVSLNMGADTSVSPEDLIAMMIESSEDMFGEVESLTIGDLPVLRTAGEESGLMAVLFAVDFGESGVGAVVQATVIGEESNFEDTTRAIIATMAATAPVEPTETGTVIWQQLREIDPTVYGEGYSSTNDIVVGPDDTIYVLDASVGVHSFDADGNELGDIVPDSLIGSMETLAIDAEGMLWTVDYMGPVIQFNSAGETLSSFDLSAVTEPAYFGLDLAIGPDGSLYILNPYTNEEDQEVGEVLVFSPAGELLRRFEIGIDDYFYEANILFGADGNLYVAEYFGVEGVKVFDSEGTLLSSGMGANQVYSMSGLAVSAAGDVYIAQPDSPILHYASDGTLLGSFGDSQYMDDTIDWEAETLPAMNPGVFYSIGGIGVLSNGDVIVGDSNSNWWHLTRINFAG